MMLQILKIETHDQAKKCNKLKNKKKKSPFREPFFACQQPSDVT